MTVPEVLRSVAAHGLPGRQGVHLTAPMDDPSWQELLQAVRRQRLAGLLMATVEHEVLAVTDAQAEQVAELHLQACATVLHLERRLLEVTAQLERAGIASVVLKGSALAHLSYPEPSLRLFGDNDLLLPGERFDEAQQVLGELGYRRPVRQARPDFDRRFGKGATLQGPDGDELDLHRTLVFGSFGFLIEPETLFSTAVPFHLGGHTLRALGPEARLLHACYHAALGDPRPRYTSVRDVAQLLAFGDHDSEAVLELLRRWCAEPVVARAATLCRDHLGVDVSGLVVETARAHAPDRRARRAIDSYVGANRSFAAKVVASLPYLPGLRAKAAFLRAAALPDPAFAADHGTRGTLAWVRRGLRSLLRGRRG